MNSSELKAGDILVAHPSLGFDPDFGGSVIVILARGPSTVGVNVASGHMTSNLFKGGPLKMPVPVALHQSKDSIASSRAIPNTNYALTEMDDYTRTVELMQKNPQKMAVLAGYAGWGPGQLEGEMAQGLWKKAEGLSLEELLSTWPKDRWNLASSKVQPDAKAAVKKAANSRPTP